MITDKRSVDKLLSLFNELLKILNENKNEDITYQISEIQYLLRFQKNANYFNMIILKKLLKKFVKAISGVSIK